MGIAMRGRRLRMPEQLSNDGKAEPRACPKAGERMTEIMKADAFQFRGALHSRPRFLEVCPRRAFLGAGDDMRIALYARQRRQNRLRSRREVNWLFAGF
jgi:hypothetical protein